MSDKNDKPPSNQIKGEVKSEPCFDPPDNRIYFITGNVPAE